MLLSLIEDVMFRNLLALMCSIATNSASSITSKLASVEPYSHGVANMDEIY